MCSQLVLVGHLLLTINSSVNFPVYYLGNCRKVARLLLSVCGVRPDLLAPPVLDHQPVSTRSSESVMSHSVRETVFGGRGEYHAVARGGRRGKSCDI